MKDAKSKFPIWTPDGSRIVYASDASGKWDLWSVPIRDGKAAGPRSVERRDLGEFQPVGMTRSSFYYIRTLNAVRQFSIAELGSSSGHRIEETIVGMVPTWSPQGNFVAFLRGSQRDRGHDLVVRSVESGTENVYGSAAMRVTQSTWLHDGSGLLQQIVDIQAGPTSVYFADIRREEFRQVLPSLPDTRRGEVLTLSPDNKTVYFFAGDVNPAGSPKNRIIASDLSTGQSTTVFKAPGTLRGIRSIALSPDGQMFALIGSDSQRRQILAVFRVDGSEYREIYGPYRGTTSLSLAWTKNSRSILLPRRTDDGSDEIVLIGMDGGNPQATGFIVKGLDTFSVSPDGSRIAFNTTDAVTSTTELVAINNLTLLQRDTK